MRLRAEEPAATGWRPVGVPELTELLLASAAPASRRPRIIAIDGRGASGKSTLVDALSSELANSGVVHTDDLAWHEPFFGWGQLLAEHILAPLAEGHPIDFRPPAWLTHQRAGSIQLPGALDVVFIEGTGASQRGHAEFLDATVWVQADHDEAERRGLARDIASGVNGDANQATRFWHEWMAHEYDFLAAERPWDRAELVVAGTPVIDLGPGQWAVGSISDARPDRGYR